MTTIDSRLVRRAERVFPGGSINDFSLPADRGIVVDRASGVDLWDSTGKHYVDFLLGSGPLVLGHGHPAVVRAITEQVGRGTTYYLPNRPAVDLAEQICHFVPCAESVRYCSDGSEAVFYALRVARAHTGRTKILKFEGGFHGHTDYALQSFVPTGAPRYPTAFSDSLGIPDVVGDTVLVVPYNDISAVEAVVAEHGDAIAAILTEPVQRGICAAPGFLASLRAVADRIGALLIFDEVVTGFRLDMGGAQSLFRVTPDLCALGKAMSGGTALACVAGRRDIMDQYAPSRAPRGVYMSGTLNGNPLGCVAGLAAVNVMHEIDGCGIITDLGERLQAGLSGVFTDAGIAAAPIGVPAFTDVVFGRSEVHNYRDYIDSDRQAAIDFGSRMLAMGFLIRPGSKIYLSAVHTSAHIESFVSAAAEVTEQMRGEGLLAEAPTRVPPNAGPPHDESLTRA
ncbi:aminotransferase class III-fold pyridoxal phosphate-dependent enzyme [Dactylosporangium darangshiense]|uniref:Aminotransferase class III-fold pyridoxal phosphate-dependent enzyme n=1 Tax=Dactylosporangium darangshiense TaxID=579108 RepID=A0ABP8DWT4_9ACTN